MHTAASIETNSSQKKHPHILVLRFSAMGDVAMIVPVLSVLRQTYPEIKVTVASRSFFRPLFSQIPNVHFYEADINGVHSGVMGLSSLAKELKDEEEIDMVADLHDVLRTNILRSIFYLYGIPFKQIDKGRAEKKALTRSDNKVFQQLKSTHQRYADVFKNLGYPIDLNNYRPPKKRKLLPKIYDIVGKQSQKWLGIAPFAQHNSKVYPADLMEEVIAEINKTGHYKILLFGGGEKEKLQLAHWEKEFQHCVSLVGKLSLAEELTVISNLDGMLSMDSGNAHFAAIYEIPVITLWGVTHPFTGFSAFGQPMQNSILPDLHQYPKIPTSVYGNKVPAGYEDVMRSIPPEKVIRKILELI
ncbi:glycosyltransferase family 9 protein [Gramella sp. AN32]|uniref:Glycosyltransferase family 9 protein n=1 Tax=Christiangramia antarctica TaxID=2058158 RepID=A0ABW5X1D6_9FLAO|nr:glycosyltransferase family 9 protein [Gramella sp. AN32]MCM4155026.1 ADP-heptose--LPS heptosyltransferase RfaF [Gramella sp. AN32]